MISIKKEKWIRLLLKDGLSNRKTARRVGVSRGTVNTIAKLPNLRKRKRSPKALRKLRKPRKCKTCGERVDIWPCLICHPKVGDYDDSRSRKEINKVPTSEIPVLLGIIYDIKELHKLHLINHPLFCDLARRARKSLKRIITNRSM